MTAIDLSEQLDDIRCRYPEYWRSDEAQRVFSENCQPVTPRKITTASGEPPSGLKISPSQEAPWVAPATSPIPTR
jgi:hypothetical protein